MNFSYHFRRITNNSGQLAKYMNLENQVSALRGQLLFRSKNLGVKQLDLIVGSWANRNIHNLNKQQLTQYNNEVLHQETPDLVKKLLGQIPISPEQKFVKIIREYARDSNYSKIQ